LSVFFGPEPSICTDDAIRTLKLIQGRGKCSPLIENVGIVIGIDSQGVIIGREKIGKDTLSFFDVGEGRIKLPQDFLGDGLVFKGKCSIQAVGAIIGKGNGEDFFLNLQGFSVFS